MQLDKERKTKITMDSRWADTTDEEDVGFEVPESHEAAVEPQQVSFLPRFSFLFTATRLTIFNFNGFSFWSQFHRASKSRSLKD